MRPDKISKAERDYRRNRRKRDILCYCLARIEDSLEVLEDNPDLPNVSILTEVLESAREQFNAAYAEWDLGEETSICSDPENCSPSCTAPTTYSAIINDPSRPK
jgi:hypothetical protein